MARGVRYGNTHGRVDKTQIGEAIKRSRDASDAEEVWVEPLPHPSTTRRRPSRECDPHNVSRAYQFAFAYLIDLDIFTPEEICSVLHISRPTFYRHRKKLRELRENGPNFSKADDWDD